MKNLLIEVPSTFKQKRSLYEACLYTKIKVKQKWDGWLSNQVIWGNLLCILQKYGQICNRFMSYYIVLFLTVKHCLKVCLLIAKPQLTLCLAVTAKKAKKLDMVSDGTVGGKTAIRVCNNQ